MEAQAFGSNKLLELTDFFDLLARFDFEDAKVVAFTTISPVETALLESAPE